MRTLEPLRVSDSKPENPREPIRRQVSNKLEETPLWPQTGSEPKSSKVGDTMINKFKNKTKQNNNKTDQTHWL